MILFLVSNADEIASALTLTYHDLLGFLDRLCHVVTLLFSCIDGEDGQLVELDAVQEGGPGTDTNSLVGDTAHTNPGIFGVHLLHNLVQMGLLGPNNKQAEHLVGLACHSNCRALLCLEDALELFYGSLTEFLGFLRLVGRDLQERRHFLPDGREHQPGRRDFLHEPLLLNDAKDRDDVDEVIFVCTAGEWGHGEVGAIWHLGLDLLPFLFLDLIGRGKERNWGPRARLSFFAFHSLEAFQRGFGAGTHS